jgi:hypothetical protein
VQILTLKPPHPTIVPRLSYTGVRKPLAHITTGINERTRLARPLTWALADVRAGIGRMTFMVCSVLLLVAGGDVESLRYGLAKPCLISAPVLSLCLTIFVAYRA